MKRAERFAAIAKEQTGNEIDPKFFNSVSQYAHFGMMFFVTVFSGTVSALWYHPYAGILVGFLGCTLYALIHEFWYDPQFENAETRGSDLEDFVFLMLGSCAGAVILLIWNGLAEL